MTLKGNLENEKKRKGKECLICMCVIFLSFIFIQPIHARSSQNWQAITDIAL